MKNIIKFEIGVFQGILYIISAILSIMTLLAIMLVLKDSFYLNLSFTNNGFINLLNLFKPFETLLAATFIIIPINLGFSTFISNLNNQEGKVLLELRNFLSTNENLEIHQKLRGASGAWSPNMSIEDFKNKDTWRKIDNYIGIMELINILIDKGVISYENFNSQFGYRVKNIYDNPEVMNYLIKSKEYNKNFFSLLEKKKLIQKQKTNF